MIMLKFTVKAGKSWRKLPELLGIMCVNDARQLIYALAQPIKNMSSMNADLMADLKEKGVELNAI